MRNEPWEALSGLGLTPTEVVVEHLSHNRWLTPGIWRVSVAGQPMVVKCLSPDRPAPETPGEAHWVNGVDEPRQWNYWAREGLAYRDRLVEIYQPGGIVAPLVLDAHYADDAIVLLLEFVEGRPGEQWAVADYAGAAAALGRAQGLYLSRSEVPDRPWLSRSFLRHYSSAKPVDWRLLDDDDDAWHPRPLEDRGWRGSSASRPVRTWPKGGTVGAKRAR